MSFELYRWAACMLSSVLGRVVHPSGRCGHAFSEEAIEGHCQERIGDIGHAGIISCPFAGCEASTTESNTGPSVSQSVSRADRRAGAASGV